MTHTKRRFSIVLALLILVLPITLAGCGSSKSASSSSDKLAKQKTLVVATSGTLYPTSFHGDDKKLTGFDVEVAKAVAKGLHKKIQFKEMDVSGTMSALNNGTVDMAVNDYSISKKREKQFALSTPYKFSFDSMIVRKKDQSGIHSFADLKGKKTGGEAGTSYQRLAKQLGATPVNYDNVSNDVYLKDVANGRTDAILNDYYLQSMALKALPDMNKKLMIPSNLYFATQNTKNGSGILMKKSNTALKDAVNKELAKLLKNGTIKKISEKYYGGADVTHKPQVHIAKTFTVKDSEQ